MRYIYIILFLLSASGLYAQNYYEADSVQVNNTYLKIKHFPDYGTVRVENSQNNFNHTYRYKGEDYYCIRFSKENQESLKQIMREVFSSTQINEYRQDDSSHSFGLVCYTDFLGNVLGVSFSARRYTKIRPEDFLILEQRIKQDLILYSGCNNFSHASGSATFLMNTCSLSFRDL